MTENNTPKPRIDPKFIVTIDDENEFIKYPALLDIAHAKGLAGIQVDIVQLPASENGTCAICRAIVTSQDGAVYSDIGDATPDNVSSRVRKHILRMASTRAIARALRSYTNIGIACIEEITDVSDAAAADEKPRRKKRAPAKQKAHGNGNGTESGNGNGKAAGADSDAAGGSSSGPSADQPKLSQAQKRAILNLAKRRKIADQELKTISVESFGTEVDYLSSRDASSFIQMLQKPCQ